MKKGPIVIIGFDATKPVFGVSEKARLKAVSLTRNFARSKSRLSNERKINALIRMHGCAGWSAPFLFTSPEDRFTHVKTQFVCIILVPSVNVSSCSFGHGIYGIHTPENVTKTPKFASRKSTVSLYRSTEIYHAYTPMKYRPYQIPQLNKSKTCIYSGYMMKDESKQRKRGTP